MDHHPAEAIRPGLFHWANGKFLILLFLVGLSSPAFSDLQQHAPDPDSDPVPYIPPEEPKPPGYVEPTAELTPPLKWGREEEREKRNKFAFEQASQNGFREEEKKLSSILLDPESASDEDLKWAIQRLKDATTEKTGTPFRPGGTVYEQNMNNLIRLEVDLAHRATDNSPSAVAAKSNYLGYNPPALLPDDGAKKFPIPSPLSVGALPGEDPSPARHSSGGIGFTYDGRVGTRIGNGLRLPIDGSPVGPGY